MKDQMKQKSMKMMKVVRTHILTMMKTNFSIVTKNAQLVGAS
jgi:hypothetical protein